MQDKPSDFTDIVKEHYASVFRFCARRLGQDLAADAAQETFLTAQRGFKRFEGRSSIACWLFGIANNHCRNLARKRRIEVPLEDLWSAAEVNGMERTIIDRQALRDALKGLSPEHRDVVLLHEVEGMSYLEAAQVLGVPEGTVKSRLHHAFVQLRRSLGSFNEVTA